MTVAKPKLHEKVSYEKFYDYDELVTYVEHKLGHPLRDTLGSFKHFDEWCDFMGYGWVDPEGKVRGSSKVWFAEYQAHPEGEAKRPEYRDFWHWLIDQYGVRNGSLVRFELREDLESLPENKAWVKEILECMIAEFGEEFNVFIEW